MIAHLFAGCLIAFAAAPDIIPRGYRHIAVTLRFEAQPILDHCCVQVVINKGDTLSKIAKVHCGTATAVKDIVALNPGINPNILAVGQRIWLPPGLADARKLPKTFVFHAQNWPLDAGGSPFAPMAHATPPRYGKTALLLVPEKQMKAFTAVQRKWQPIQTMAKDKLIEKIEVSCWGSNVASHDPTHKRTDTITIQRSDKGIYSASVKSVAYDKKGKVITPASLKTPRDKRGMWLLLLPVGGAGWLFWRVRRRRPDFVAATA